MLEYKVSPRTGCKFWSGPEYRAYQRNLSESRKKFNEEHPPKQSGRKLCPRCQRVLSRRQFCIAVRQPDGLQHYCQDCNRAHLRLYYWTQRIIATLRMEPKDAAKVLAKARLRLPRWKVTVILMTAKEISNES